MSNAHDEAIAVIVAHDVVNREYSSAPYNLGAISPEFRQAVERAAEALRRQASTQTEPPPAVYDLEL